MEYKLKILLRHMQEVDDELTDYGYDGIEQAIEIIESLLEEVKE